MANANDLLKTYSRALLEYVFTFSSFMFRELILVVIIIIIVIIVISSS